MAQVVKHLTSKYEALSSKCSTEEKKILKITKVKRVKNMVQMVECSQVSHICNTSCLGG
jgi:hypothetical protein